MGFPTKVQLISRKASEQYYINFPSAVAQAMESTPDQLRQDESVPWQNVGGFAAGKRHEFRIKTLERVLWRKAGADLPLRIVGIAPLGYRL